MKDSQCPINCDVHRRQCRRGVRFKTMPSRVAEAINRQGPLPPLAADKARAPPAGTGQSRVVHFRQDRTEDGRRFRMLTVIDEFARRYLAIVVARRLRSDDVHFLTDLFVAHGPPAHPL
jgi:transposase InsO family protein